MAEGFANFYRTSDITILSAGSKPASKVNPNAILVMKELGIDISDHKPKLLTMNLIKKTTHFVSMGCGIQDSCPVPLFQVNIVDWEIDDPAGKDLDFFRSIRDIIKMKIVEFLRGLNKLNLNLAEFL
jgi:arsenate reductase (thioredoxin)